MSRFVYDKAAVGARIRKKRSALRLTQDDLAEKIDMSGRSVTDLERGAVGMSIETLLDLCDALKTTPNDLLLPDAGTEESELDWALDALRNSSEHVRATAIDILRAYLRAM